MPHKAPYILFLCFLFSSLLSSQAVSLHLHDSQHLADHHLELSGQHYHADAIDVASQPHAHITVEIASYTEKKPSSKAKLGITNWPTVALPTRQSTPTLPTPPPQVATSLYPEGQQQPRAPPYHS